MEVCNLCGLDLARCHCLEGGYVNPNNGGFVAACRRHFCCDEDGNLYRLSEPGKRVGCVHSTGYLVISLRKQEVADFGVGKLQAHRVVYALCRGVEADTTNHLDGNPLNNRIDNLENGDNRNNLQQQELHRNGRLPGCYWNKQLKRWQARLTYNDYLLHVGYYDSEEEANAAYKDLCGSLQKTEESLDWSVEIERIIDERPGLRQKYEEKLSALLVQRAAARARKEAAAARDAATASLYAAGGINQRELARQFGVDQKTVLTAIHKNHR
jgi:DNA-binding CsgD family transcriptional regulator